MLQNFKTIKNKFDGEKMDDLKQTKNEDKKPASISLTVYDDSSFLSPYSSDNEEIISDEVAGFLENSAKQIKPTRSLKINIKSKTIAENEKPVYLRAIKNYYENESAEIKRNLKFNLIATLILFAISVVVLLVLFLVVAKFNIQVLTEIVTIMAWVFLWEAVDLFFIRRPLLRRELHRCENLKNSEIVFLNFD